VELVVELLVGRGMLATTVERRQAASSTEVEMGSVSLIVMEHGAAWPGRVGDHENLVAVRDDGEVLLQRTLEKLESLQRRGQHLRIAALACNAETDGAPVAHRARLAHELLRAVAAVGFGRLLMTTPNGASMPLRRELLTLANALRETFASTATTVAVRFGDHDSVYGPATSLRSPRPHAGSTIARPPA
jgi:hypothetical protein